VQSKTDNLITVATAAGMIGVTSQAVRDFIRQGEFPGAVKISQAANAPYILPANEVKSFLDRRNKSAK